MRSGGSEEHRRNAQDKGEEFDRAIDNGDDKLRSDSQARVDVHAVLLSLWCVLRGHKKA